jgi:hypothetical protein
MLCTWRPLGLTTKSSWSPPTNACATPRNFSASPYSLHNSAPQVFVFRSCLGRANVPASPNFAAARRGTAAAGQALDKVLSDWVVASYRKWRHELHELSLTLGAQSVGIREIRVSGSGAQGVDQLIQFVRNRRLQDPGPRRPLHSSFCLLHSPPARPPACTSRERSRASTTAKTAFTRYSQRPG